MDENTGYSKVEDVVGCHVEDAVTFWAQNMSRNNDILKLSHALAEVCPQANSVFGNPDFTKIYGGCFSEDKCWYRCKVQQVISDEKEEKETSKETLKHLGKTLQTYVGTKMRSLAAQIEVLKNVRCSHMNVHFGDDLFRAVKEVTERCLIAPSSLEKLEKIWAEYNLAQEMIQLCRNVNESDILILKRNEVRQNLYSAVEEFILEVDELPLSERSTILQSDDYSEYEITKIKEDITGLRNNLIQEIYNEQEEYETLTYLVQKWFPELPLLHPEAGILKYMNSGGLLAVSLERDLLDAEPLKELSTKHPLVCSEVQEQKVLLKGYAVDVSTEAKVIERTARYHRAWSEFKEKSGLLQLMFLFLCKSDPLVYLMVPYYPGASLGALQASTPLTSEEILKVMEGVARGLHTLHKANIVHGSLHTNNVFAVNRKQGIVGDFDFTKSVDQRASADSMVVGNLNLISPELRMGHLASPSSDMYAYGCLLFWLFAGDQEFKIKENGTPEVDELNMDDKVKSLLLNLICSNRMTAEQVLNDDCFLLPDVIPAPPQNEPGEKLKCEKAEEKGEVIINSDKKIDDEEEMDPSQ
uniref:Protein kinase domain-containing protein n=1 Tax=Gopherus agassizii TaxID=38772 RepID=A0A452GYG4_9SAUR